MWKPLKWGRQLIRERCAALRLQHMFGSQHSYFLGLTLFNISVPYISGGPYTHTLLLNLYNLFLSKSIFLPSLPVSPVPGKVIRKGFSVVEMKVAMTKG